MNGQLNWVCATLTMNLLILEFFESQYRYYNPRPLRVLNTTCLAGYWFQRTFPRFW